MLDIAKLTTTKNRPKPVNMGLLRMMVANSNKASELNTHEISWLVGLSLVSGDKIKITSCTSSSQADGKRERSCHWKSFEIFMLASFVLTRPPSYAAMATL